MFCLTEQLTYWEPGVENGTGGKSWNAPVTVPARIAFRKRETRDTNGNIVTTDNDAYCEADLERNWYIVAGVSVEPIPTNVVDAKKIVDFTKIPSGTNMKRYSY